MRNDKRKYEKLIEKTHLLMMETEIGTIAYKRETRRLAEYLYSYLMTVNKGANEPYAAEIMETAVRCMKNYESERGRFLHYFNAAWKRARGHCEAKETTERGGAMNVGEIVTESNGEETSIWEQLSDGKLIEEEYESEYMASEILNKVETAYKGLQERQKPIISDVMTAKLLPYCERDVNGYSFISREIAERWQMTGEVPTQREIAEKYRRDEGSISRTANRFLKKLRLITEGEQGWD